MDKQASKSPEWDLRINFKCNECGYLEAKASELVTHSIEKHCSNKFYWCFLCRKYSSDLKANVLQHMRDKHNAPSDIFFCPLCFKIPAQEEEEIEAHLIREHWLLKQVYCCRLCCYKSDSNINKHIQKAHKEPSCSNCSFKGKSPAEVFNHIMNTHFPKLEVYYSCPYCDTMFSQQHSADQHCLAKHGIELNSDDDDDDVQVDIICNLCENYKCEKKETYYKHLKTKHDIINFACPFDQCSFSSLKFWKYAAHVAGAHISSKKFVCPKCAASFSEEQSLRQHIDDKHFCDLQDLCNCSFILGSMKDHLEEVHGLNIEKESCRLCGMQLNDDIYYNHMSLKHGINFPEGVDELYDDD